MRILYVVNGFDPGGAEHGLLTLLQTGFFAGHDLKILGFCRGRGALAERVADEIGAANVVLASSGETLTAQACVAGARALWRQHKEWRPDLVVLSLKQANVIGRLIASFFPSSRCVSFEHISRYRARRAEWAYRYLLWALSFRVDEIWADCQETLRDTDRYFIPRLRTRHIVPPYNTGGSAIYKTDYTAHAPLRLAAAGRLVARKHFRLVIDAIRVLRNRGVDVHLDIYGDGPDMGMLSRAVTEHGLGSSVHFAGYTQDWCKTIVEHDIFVNMSDTEGFCIVVAEAMAAGVPVIATSVGGIREYGVAERNIAILDTPAVDALVAQIERLAADEPLRRRLGQQARRDMVANYSPQAMRALSQFVLAPQQG